MVKKIIWAFCAAMAVMSVSPCQAGTVTGNDGRSGSAVSGGWNDGRIRIVAHRGFWNCEEAGYARNSVAALRCAQEAGVWGSEFDVNMTSDGVILVYHDGSINGKAIDRNPYSEFKDVRLENGEKIPVIDDYLKQALKHPETVLVYELKVHSTPEIEARLVERTVEKLKEYGLYDPAKVVFISFSKFICDKIAAEMPEFICMYLRDDLGPDQLDKDGINGVDYHYSVFGKHPDWLRRIRELGMFLNCWTVNDVKDMQEMIRLGIDCITTDNPLELRQELKATSVEEVMSF